MEGVGFTAIRHMTGAPVEMPPRMPPALLDSTSILPVSASMRYGSLFSLPRMAATAKPMPNSTPFTAGMANRAAASWLSRP